MKNPRHFIFVQRAFVLVLVALLLGGCPPPTNGPPPEPTATATQPPAIPFSGFLMMNPPPDSDKPMPQPNTPPLNLSCGMHTAANMLAAAGYGNGNTVQERAEDIFIDLAGIWGDYGGNGVWPGTALQVWLISHFFANPTDPNPYRLVRTYGNVDCTPWMDYFGSRFIANELRAYHPVGTTIRWPHAEDAADPDDCKGGHAITAMGDDVISNAPLTTGPGDLAVTDSDRDWGGNVQSYTYDDFTNPNQGGPNEGFGWYLDYSVNHPYIIQAVTLSPTTSGANSNSTLSTGSYTIQQTCDQDATGLSYEVGTDVEILTYRTWLDVSGANVIQEIRQWNSLFVDWSFADPVQQGEWVTINTELVETEYSAIWYGDVHFTYPPGYDECDPGAPGIYWRMTTPTIPKAEEIPNVIGGYVIGGFDIISEDNPDLPPVHYRFQHQYNYNQDPELHWLLFDGSLGYSVTNLAFGHTYGILPDQQLWEFESWITMDDGVYPLGEGQIEIEIDWDKLLPYPEFTEPEFIIPEPIEGSR